MNSKGNKIMELWNRLNKKVLLIGLSAIVLIVVIIIVVIALNSKTEYTCTRNYTVSDFTFNEELVIVMKKDKSKENKGKNYYIITDLELDKNVTIGDKLKKFPTYDKVLLDKFNKAYAYLDKKVYKIEQKDHVTSVTVSISEDNLDKKNKEKNEKLGLILDNIKIIENNKENIHDLTFNHVEEIESSSTAYKINDTYTKDTIKVKLEGLGYTCK